MEEKKVFTRPVFIYDDDHKELMKRKIESGVSKIADVIKQLIQK